MQALLVCVFWGHPVKAADGSWATLPSSGSPVTTLMQEAGSKQQPEDVVLTIPAAEKSAEQ